VVNDKQFLFMFFPAASYLKSSKPSTIVLSGLSGSGKTTIFYQVTSNIFGRVLTIEEQGCVILFAK
jgi:adenylylsulfate kinase-like enzyme